MILWSNLEEKKCWLTLFSVGLEDDAWGVGGHHRHREGDHQAGREAGLAQCPRNAQQTRPHHRVPDWKAEEKKSNNK